MAKNIEVTVEGERGANLQVPGGADWEIEFQFMDVDGARLPITAAAVDFYDAPNRTGAVAFTKTLTLGSGDGEAKLTTPDTDTDFVIGQKRYGFCRCTEAGGDLSVSPTYFIVTVY